MFTLKFYMHNDDSHEVFSCERYSVSIERCERKEPDSNEKPKMSPLRAVVRMFRRFEDDNPYYETIGEQECYGHAFVVNDAGKTIDTLRVPEDVSLAIRLRDVDVVHNADGEVLAVEDPEDLRGESEEREYAADEPCLGAEVRKLGLTGEGEGNYD